MNKNYIEWCEIMHQVPNKRDEMIFLAGHTFISIDQNTSDNSNHEKCECDEFELCYRCKICGSTRMHPVSDKQFYKG